jgi:hypothetical protein
MAGITARTISALMERTGVLEGGLLAEQPIAKSRWDHEKKVSILVKTPKDDAYPARFKAFQPVAFEGLDDWKFKKVFNDEKHFAIEATATAAKQGSPAKASE